MCVCVRGVALDRCLLQGMKIIERLDPVGFTSYLRDYQNTICGRHPIGVLLNVSQTIITC